jgi:ComF family protein
LRVHWTKELKASLSPLVDFVYPPRCPSCGAAVIEQGGLCALCWSGLDPLDQSGGSDFVGTLADGEPMVIAACAYGEVSRQLVIKFKHGGDTSLAAVLARFMAVALPDWEGASAPLLAPVPLHRLRLWERGFNQAALLARELSRLKKGELLIDGLERTKRTPSLGGLGRRERGRALREAIAVPRNRRAQIAGRDILLVDDVYTSGATSKACSKALTGAGARSVQTVCFAKVVDGHAN